jgi:uncharacterized coiled-coil protein SlyX
MSDATSTARDGNDTTSCARCVELEKEVSDLRALVQQLRDKNDDLLRAAVNRDFERPPHYL